MKSRGGFWKDTQKHSKALKSWTFTTKLDVLYTYKLQVIKGRPETASGKQKYQRTHGELIGLKTGEAQDRGEAEP